jgi:preprotein translocase subunit SecG
MSTVVIVIHIVVCVALILIVLLQTGKGASMGVSFGGGGSQTLFGSSGASTFLTKLTTGAAVVFMLTSLGLAYMSGHKTVESVMSEVTPPVSAPEEEGAQEKTQAPEPTQHTEQEEGESGLESAAQEVGGSAEQVPGPAPTQSPKE